MLGERDIGDCLDDPAVTAETTEHAGVKAAQAT